MRQPKYSRAPGVEFFKRSAKLSSIRITGCRICKGMRHKGTARKRASGRHSFASGFAKTETTEFWFIVASRVRRISFHVQLLVPQDAWCRNLPRSGPDTPTFQRLRMCGELTARFDRDPLRRSIQPGAGRFDSARIADVAQRAQLFHAWGISLARDAVLFFFATLPEAVAAVFSEWISGGRSEGFRSARQQIDGHNKPCVSPRLLGGCCTCS